MKRRARRAWLLFLSSLLLGCPLSIQPSGTSAIGDTCQSSEDCGLGYCETKVQGGYCMRECSREPCPDGSRCVVYEMLFGIKTPGVCLRICQTISDCGRAGVNCGLPPSVTGEPVCY